MGERVSHGLVTIVPAHGWTRGAYFSEVVARQALALDVSPPTPRSPAKDFALASPHGPGRFHLDTVAMPTDMGAFDLGRLRKLVDARRRFSTMLPVAFREAGFDEVEWFDEGIACIGYTVVWDPSRMRELVPDHLREALKDQPPSVSRDWYLACGTDMANVWYRSPNGYAVASDIADCEDMVRSLRFGRGDRP